MADDKVKIIYRRKLVNKGSGHKRGATWKVAYADFVTAMMAFFMMLWLLSITPENKLQGIAQYFTVVESHGKESGIGVDGGADPNVDTNIAASTSASSSLVYGSPARGRRINQADDSGSMGDVEKQHFLDIMHNIQKNVEIKEYMENISIDVTEDGLRIQIMDSDNRPVFKPNTYELQPYMNKVLTVIARLIKDQPNYLALSGHTATIRDSAPPQDKAVDSWVLSAMRANEIRKFLTSNSIKTDQIGWITGKADKEPFDPKDKYNPKNIRVSITLLNDSAISHFQKSTPSELKKK